LPTPKLEVDKVAEPVLNGCGEPMAAPLSLNCTVPVGVPLPVVTVAVKVTF
jgi:hypothetical protein